jgi:23S rRNA (guanosine2251-2'-O)-methyltransferase
MRSKPWAGYRGGRGGWQGEGESARAPGAGFVGPKRPFYDGGMKQHPPRSPHPSSPGAPAGRSGERRPARAETGPGRRPPPRPPEPPKGTLWLYGLHAVAAALANPQRRLRRLLLTEEAEKALAEKLPPPWPLLPERVDRGRLDFLLGAETAHQGAALLADPLTPPPLATALERKGPVLVLDQVTDPRNIGAILRSAAAFGAACVILQERHAPPETGAMAKAAAGALERVPVLRAVNISRTLVALKAAGLWVVGLDASGPPLSGPALAGRRVALVLGGEGAGLRRLTRETCDEIAGLPMPGGMESLNVSAAAAIALYELSRAAPLGTEGGGG